mmetsp:Transcript_48914/g.93518  ORF Transcript_48914/g.93518 Transcript_48914/m.93518 type:complete len:272 (-) Transcript_48914:123-938(-)
MPREVDASTRLGRDRTTKDAVLCEQTSQWSPRLLSQRVAPQVQRGQSAIRHHAVRHHGEAAVVPHGVLGKFEASQGVVDGQHAREVQGGFLLNGLQMRVVHVEVVQAAVVVVQGCGQRHQGPHPQLRVAQVKHSQGLVHFQHLRHGLAAALPNGVVAHVENLQPCAGGVLLDQHLRDLCGAVRGDVVALEVQLFQALVESQKARNRSHSGVVQVVVRQVQVGQMLVFVKRLRERKHLHILNTLVEQLLAISVQFNGGDHHLLLNSCMDGIH